MESDFFPLRTIRIGACDFILWKYSVCDIRCIQAATLRTPSPSSFIHPTCSACQLDVFQFGPQLSVRRGPSPPISTSLSALSASRLPNSPEVSVRVNNHVPPTSHSHHTATQRRPPSITWVRSPIISKSASPLIPMRQKEKEAETNRLRSSCTLDPRYQC